MKETKYKQTEVGLIPSDWEVFTFGDIVNYTKGFAFKSKDYRKDGIRIIRVSDTTYDNIKKENGIYVDENDATDYKNWRLDQNDLIFTTVGSKPPMYDSMVGKVIMVSKEFEGSLLNQNAVLIRAKKRTEELQALLLSHFRTKRYLQHIELIYRGNANQASITLKELFEFKIPLPKNEIEQTAIATALSDADALISSLSTLIAKKRMIKQGAMQQLLQPKEGWEVKKLGEVGECHRGVSYNPERDLHQHDKDITIRLLRSNNVQNQNIELNGLQFVDQEKVKLNQILQDNDIVICMANGSKQLVGKAAIYRKKDNLKYTFGAFMGCFRTNVDLASSSYIAFNFQSFQYRNYIDVLLSGSSINNLNPGNIESIEIPFPSPEEQTRIATILSDMDEEIAALEIKLEKYRKVKLAMMQNLLTGKIRLV
jgi:type I restriction enzyme S subunit